MTAQEKRVAQVEKYAEEKDIEILRTTVSETGAIVLDAVSNRHNGFYSWHIGTKGGIKAFDGSGFVNGQKAFTTTIKV